MNILVQATYSELLLENQVQRELLLEQSLVIKDLNGLVSKLSARVLELEKQIGKTSENSSKPPSTDGFKKVIQHNREKTDRKSGGQKGHKGHTLKYAEGESISELIYVAVAGTCDCGASLALSGKALSYERRQVINLPALIPYITEYQVEQKVCGCGKRHRAVCEVPYHIQYGHTVQAAVGYFQTRQLIPVARTQEIMADIFSLTHISAGTVLSSSEIAFDRLADWEAQQIELLRQSAFMHVDETGLPVNGHLDWGHVCSTPEITLYQHHSKRGKAAHVAHGIIDHFEGVLVHDRYSSYNGYVCDHALCNAHLFRDLKSIIADKTPAGAWAGEMYALINEIHQGLHSGVTLEVSYAKILAQGFATNPQPVRQEGQRGKIKKSESLNLLECYRDKKADILRFFYQKNVPFDNNLAERDLRMFKLKQKISGSFRTESGAKVFCRVASFIATLKKQGLNVWQNLCELYRNQQQWAMPTE
jgi:transposase